MPRFIIKRNFAERIESNPEYDAEIRRVNDETGIQWIFSFLSADKKRTYCLYEAPSAEALLQAAKRLNLPADEITEVGGCIGFDRSDTVELRPGAF